MRLNQDVRGITKRAPVAMPFGVPQSLSRVCLYKVFQNSLEKEYKKFHKHISALNLIKFQDLEIILSETNHKIFKKKIYKKLAINSDL